MAVPFRGTMRRRRRGVPNASRGALNAAGGAQSGSEGDLRRESGARRVPEAREAV